MSWYDLRHEDLSIDIYCHNNYQYSENTMSSKITHKNKIYGTALLATFEIKEKCRYRYSS